jgi:hypothetical protein
MCLEPRRLAREGTGFVAGPHSCSVPRQSESSREEEE